MTQKNWAWDNRSHNWFQEGSKGKDRAVVSAVDEIASSDDDVEVYVAEWVDTPCRCFLHRQEHGGQDCAFQF
jgi:hypothetical protein